jgi:hypothetical protein
VARLRGELFRSSRRHAGPVRQPDCLDCRGEEGGLLADGVDERDALDRECRGEGDTRKAAAAAEVEKSADIAKEPGRGQAVDDVPKGNIGGFPDGRQVDRLVPGEEQPDMVIDRAAGGRRQDEIQFAESGLQRNRVGGRQFREPLNARRERLTRTVQAPLLTAVPVRPVPAPLPASSFFAPTGRGSRSSVASPVRGRVSPYPSQAALPERSRCG